MTENLVRRAAPSSGRRLGGPHPGIVALVALLLTLLGLVVGAAMSKGHALESPFTSSQHLAHRIGQYRSATRVMAWIQVGSAVPLGILSATIYVRQQKLGVRVPGPVIGVFGGFLASTMLMLSGLIGWVSSRHELATDPTLLHALSFLSFITGSVGFVLGMGLLVAGLAVPGHLLRLLPRWLTWVGLVLAACCELSFVAMVAQPLQFLFPIGRFGGLLWLVAAGFLLPASRRSPWSEVPA
ncbi:hypothetical protein [Allobranchiibius huperziae]|uniref:DUF4386 domain-containing protein n=1 Tax=Allobranchiibius huperziae TaxID=1874116 RepID=A0A853DJ33_9MICO|nr:hypothetical protein [Allobranchiibius huperziae]NYJ76043.1 hypothetical protein [Allobranchiibius huperziae]